MKKTLTTLIFSLFFLIACGAQTSDSSTTDDTGTTEGTGTTTTEELCDNSTMPSYQYMMAFHACDSENLDCSIPNNHYTYLAGSDDGVSWNLIDSFESVNASVPGIAYYNNKLYLIVAGANDGDEQFDWRTYNACLQPIDQGLLERDVAFDTGTGFTDPSPIVINDELVIVHKASTTGSSTTPCAAGCTMDFASATEENFPSFTDQGSLVSLTLPIGGFTDPQIVQKNDGTYLLYGSNGSNIYAFSSNSLEADTFTSADYDNDGINGDNDDKMGPNVGGVPGAIQGDDDKIWLYVNTEDPANHGVYQIRRALLTTGTESVTDADFTTVMDDSILPSLGKASVESPYIIQWPDANWTKVIPAQE